MHEVDPPFQWDVPLAHFLRGLVQRVARWVGDMLRMFGLGEGESNDIGWGQERSAEEGNVNVRACARAQRLLLTTDLFLVLSETVAPSKSPTNLLLVSV